MDYLKTFFSESTPNPVPSSSPSSPSCSDAKQESTPNPVPSSSPSSPSCSDSKQELEAEWRKMAWSENEKENEKERDKMLQELTDLKTSSKIEHLNIMLTGPIGAGKSTFINSVQTAFLGRMCSNALTNSALTGVSFTVKYKNHKLKKKDGSFLPFLMSDTMGIEPAKSRGIHNKDIKKILKGKIKEGYRFNPLQAIKEKDVYYNSKPTLKDKVHCLVFILPADILSLIEENVFKKMKDVREMACDLNIPQVVIMTKVDDACELVNKDLKKVYISKKIKEKMEQCQCKLGVPMNYIFPVKNYSQEIDANAKIDILILKALTNIANLANDFVEAQTEEENSF